MKQIFAHRPASVITLLHDLVPSDPLPASFRYRRRGVSPRRHILVRKTSRRA